MIASQSISANNKGSLSVYQSQGDYVQGSGYTYSGGNLNLNTPLITGAAASVNTITAGGALTITAPAGVTPAVVGGEALAPSSISTPPASPRAAPSRCPAAG